jgi:hypothetical protein
MMNLPQIRINSLQGQLGLEITKSIQKIDQEPANVQMEQPKAELQINRTPGKLTIDQTKAWEDMDLKHIFRRIEECAQNGYQDLMSGIARVTQQGDELMKIENGGSPIIEQAVQNSLPTQFDFNIGWVPSHFSVKIDYQQGKLDIKWKANRPNIEVDINKPIHDYTPGKVSGYMKQWPTLEIDFVGGSINQEI